MLRVTESLRTVDECSRGGDATPTVRSERTSLGVRREGDVADEAVVQFCLLFGNGPLTVCQPNVSQMSAPQSEQRGICVERLECRTHTTHDHTLRRLHEHQASILRSCRGRALARLYARG